MQEINNWLEFEDYDEGLDLYKKHVKPPALLSFLSLGPTSFTREKLREALEPLASQNTKKVIVKTDSQSPGKIKSPELQNLYAERALFHARLSEQTNDSDRFKIAQRIVRLTDRINALKNPAPKKALPSDPVKLIKLRNNNRSYISAYKDRQDKQMEVMRRTAENERIEALLS